MKAFLISIAFVIYSALHSFSQADSIKYDKFIFMYVSDRQGIQTSGGDSTFTYSIYNQEGLGIKSGRLTSTFIPLPIDSFPPGEYSALFRARYRFIHKPFTIKKA